MKLYWYCFTWSWMDNQKGIGGNCSNYVGFEIKDQFTKACVEEQKKHAHPNCPPSGIVLIAINYLGYMSKEDFEKQG